MNMREKSIVGAANRTVLVALVVVGVLAGAYVIGNREAGDARDDESAARLESAAQDRAPSADAGSRALPTDNGLSELAAVLPGPDDPIRRVPVVSRDGREVDAELAGAGNLPESFPDDVPVFPGAQSAGGLAVGGEGLAAALVTESAAEAVVSFYVEELVARGWTLGAEPRDALQSDRISASKDDRTLWVVVSDAAGGAQIFLALDEQPI